jgi:hypothetical protein
MSSSATMSPSRLISCRGSKWGSPEGFSVDGSVEAIGNESIDKVEPDKPCSVGAASLVVALEENDDMELE